MLKSSMETQAMIGFVSLSAGESEVLNWTMLDCGLRLSQLKRPFLNLDN